MLTIDTSKTWKKDEKNLRPAHPHVKNHQKISSKSSNIIFENHPEKFPV